MRHDVYLYGSVLVSNAFVLASPFPEPDGYAELERIDALVSGESGIAAAILSAFGCRVKVDGYHLGRKTAPVFAAYFEDKAVDLSAMHYDDSWDGLEDYILIDGAAATRTVLGSYGHFYSNPKKRYNQPSREDFVGIRAAGIDPFNADAAELSARYCVELGVPYATMDCPPDAYLAMRSSVNALSSSYLRGLFKDRVDREPEAILREYAEATRGLVAITLGSAGALYCRSGGEPRRREAYPIEARSTLGAGDTFKAACIYGLREGMGDDEMIDFACAAAACACERYPLPENIPTLERVARMRAGARPALS
jgi:sugar/nucleoside kinase (ribokinase family)